MLVLGIALLLGFAASAIGELQFVASAAEKKARPRPAASTLPENSQVKVVSAGPADCYVYQAQCLRITLMCKKFIPLGRPVLEVSWLEADGTPFYTVVKHIAGAAHCNLGDLIHRYVPWYEGLRFTLRLP